MTVEKRIYSYDLLRTFAIITVIISHIFTNFEQTPLEYEIKEYINTLIRFSVPMFLFLAGALSRIEKIGSKRYWLNKIIRVAIPYFIFAIPGLLYPIWKYDWTISNWREILFSLILGFKFGHFYIFVIIMTYFLAYLSYKIKLFRHINLFLILTFIFQIIWLALDETVFLKLRLHDQGFLQFNVQELIFYRNPITWFCFYVLGLWYQETEHQTLIGKYKNPIAITTLILTLLYIVMRLFNFGDYTPYGSIIWSIYSVGWIFTILNIDIKSPKFKKFVTYISHRSYTIYLIHYAFIYLFIELSEIYHIKFPYWSNLIIFPFILSISLAFIYLAKRILKGRSPLIIGC